ncbi:MAG TPA: hypothetical protein VFV67_08185 [Actinophytocola sp.]|uniref:hypothetical protein n=1 Tax=Actinophytocola sp. TaxID=1872138 RepID=UPI002DBD38EB|nr:hypothetical protein [Actinophytocola sp.]HEU5470617.1 hypothetical protein [Actinophytocola sp.]
MQPTAGPAATHYAAMRRASTPRRWLLAGTLGAATGLFTHLVLPWPLALCAAALTAAGLLGWDRQHPPHRLAATAARLERHGWAALPAPIHRHQDTPIAAYLLIGPGGVFVVDHQVWWATDAVTIDPATGMLMVGSTPAARRVASVKGAAAAVADDLPNWLDTRPSFARS